MAGNPAVAERMRKIAARMRERGLAVQAIDGWATRGRDASFNPRAVVYHHTAAPTDIDRMLCDGRADLPGPLCNFALHRDGTWVLVAAGRANHAGVATVTNSESYGIEATGPVPVTSSGPLAFPNYRAYAEGVAAIFEVEGWDPGVGYGHKEVARPLGRKVDPAFDIPAFEQTVRDLMAEGPDMGLSDADKKWIEQKLDETERRVARWVDHGDADTVGSGNHHVKIRQDLDTIEKAIDALTLLVTPPPEPPA